MGKQCRENDVIVKIVKTINVESFHQLKVKPLFYLSAYVSLNVPRLTTLDSNERERKFIVVKLWFVIFIGVDTKVSECVGSCVGAVFVLYHWLDLDLIPRLLEIFEIKLLEKMILRDSCPSLKFSRFHKLISRPILYQKKFWNFWKFSIISELSLNPVFFLKANRKWFFIFSERNTNWKCQMRKMKIFKM